MTTRPHRGRDHHGDDAAHRQRRDREWLPDVGAAVELARVDVVRGVRWVAAQDFWLLYGAVSAAGMLFLSWVAFNLGRDTGSALAAGESTWFAAAGGATAWGIVWLFTAAMLAFDAVSSNGDVDNDGHYLTIRPTVDVAAGKLLAAAGKFAVFVFVPALACYLGVAAGSGTPAPLAGATAAATVTVLSATAVGYPLGFAAKGAVRRSETLSRLKPAFGVVVGVGYVYAVTTGEFLAVVEQLTPVLRAPPLGWLTDLSFSTTPGAAWSPTGAAGALLACVVAVAVGTVLSTRAARYAWQADRVRPEQDSDGDPTAPRHRVDAVLAAVTRRPASRGVASAALLRVYRSPLQLVFVAFPLVGAIPLADRLLATGVLPWYAPWLAVWYGAWAAGAAIPLNPLGNQGAALPTVLTAPADARAVVNGTVVAAALPAAPLTAGVAVAIGVAAGYAPLELVAVAAAAVAAVLVAAALAAGVGSVFPRFAAVDFSGSREAVPPSKVAYSAFSVVLTVTVGAAAVVLDGLAARVVAVLLSRHLPLVGAVGVDAVEPAAWVVLAAVGLSVPAAYRVAVARVRRYRLS